MCIYMRCLKRGCCTGVSARKKRTDRKKSSLTFFSFPPSTSRRTRVEHSTYLSLVNLNTPYRNQVPVLHTLLYTSLAYPSPLISGCFHLFCCRWSRRHQPRLPRIGRRVRYIRCVWFIPVLLHRPRRARTCISTMAMKNSIRRRRWDRKITDVYLPFRS